MCPRTALPAGLLTASEAQRGKGNCPSHQQHPGPCHHRPQSSFLAPKKVHKAEWVEERLVRPAWLTIPSEILDGLQNCHSFQKLGEPSLLCPTLFLEVVVVREAKKFPLCHPFQIDAGWTVKRPTSLAQEWPGTNYLPLSFLLYILGATQHSVSRTVPVGLNHRDAKRPGTDRRAQTGAAIFPDINQK